MRHLTREVEPGAGVWPQHAHHRRVARHAVEIVNVEGAEEAVWAGMAKRLANPRPLTVILEFTPDRYRDAGAFLDVFESQGLSLGYVHQWRGIVSTSRSEILAKPGNVDQLLVLRR